MKAENTNPNTFTGLLDFLNKTQNKYFSKNNSASKVIHQFTVTKQNWMRGCHLLIYHFTITTQGFYE